MKAVILTSFGHVGVLKLQSGLKAKLLPQSNRKTPWCLSVTQKISALFGVYRSWTRCDPIPDHSARSLVRIKCCASGVNRSDLLQRRGKYPPPKSEIPLLQEDIVPGLEVSGVVVDKGIDVKKCHIGDPVMALLTGGGYGEYVLADEGAIINLKNYIKPQSKIRNIMRELLWPIQIKEKDISAHYTKAEHHRLQLAACIPEAYLTAYQCLFTEHPNGGIKTGDNVLIHAGASGVGIAAIRICRAHGALPHVTLRSAAKASICREIGAACVYSGRNISGDLASKEDDSQFDPYPRDRSMDLIIDTVFGNQYFSSGASLLKNDGAYIVLSFLGGPRISGGLSSDKSTEMSFAPLLAKRNKIVFTTLRSRSIKYKRELVRNFEAFFQSQPIFDLSPLTVIHSGGKYFLENPENREDTIKWIRPVLYKNLPMLSEDTEETPNQTKDPSRIEDAYNMQRAHEILERNENVGKVVLYW